MCDALHDFHSESNVLFCPTMSFWATLPYTLPAGWYSSYCNLAASVTDVITKPIKRYTCRYGLYMCLEGL